MKRLFCFMLLGIVFLYGSGFKAHNCDQKFSNQPRIEVVFTDQMDFNNLARIKLDLSQKGILINYNKLEFTKEGCLTFIDFSVDCKDGFKGSAEDKLINKSHFGFYRDYADDAKSPFATGSF